MPASASNILRRTAEEITSDQTCIRTEQAAHLLREALALLDVGAKAPAALVATKPAPDRLLRLPEVERLTGLRRSAIYEQMQRGIFPRSVKVGPRAATWSEIAIQGWISDRLGRGLR